MLRLRPYKKCDAEQIAGWIKDETSFYKWSAGRFADFPITGADINRKYTDCNGDCAESDNFYPMTAFDETGTVGHLIMRFTDAGKKILRFGFVIVDDSRRGSGYGKQMIGLALQYAFEILKAEKVTIGVFENNPPARYCYRSAGFTETGEEELCEIMGETWKIIEMEIDAERNFK